MENELISWRVDYVKFKVHGEAEQMQPFLDEWNWMQEKFNKDLPIYQGGCTATMVRGAYSGHLPLWAFQMWGERAAYVASLDWERWSPVLFRMDVCKGVGFSTYGLDKLYRKFKDVNRGRLNLSLFDTRNREKVDGRTAGGDGFAVGSHASEFRITHYRKGQAPTGKIEYQLAGKRVWREVDLVQQFWDDNIDTQHAIAWKMLKEKLVASSCVEYAKNAGMPLKVAQAILSEEKPMQEEGDADIEGVMNTLSLFSDGDLHVTSYRVLEELEGRRRKRS